jgi:glycosyltransferase involved in cell wall biosynthesis
MTSTKPRGRSVAWDAEPTRSDADGTAGRPRLLAFAYACEPDRGSEPEAGWIWSRMLARIGETWVLTRSNNRPAIEAHLSAVPERQNLRFVYVDLPAWARFWKRRDKGARLYYLLWQMAALGRARTLMRDVDFHIVWHLTWANAWLGSFASLLPKPFVYGPVGGGIGMDLSFASVLGIRGTVYEVARGVVRFVARYANPIARVAWRRARLILVQNRETMMWLPRRHRDKAVVFPNVVLDRDPFAGPQPPPRGPYTALFAGRLIPWKGLALVLRAMVFLPEWRLIICGQGRDENRLKRLALTTGVNHRVKFLGWVPRNELQSRMRAADVFVFPSLHDEGGYAVAEALAEGLPVVCLARGGPAMIGGTAVKISTVSVTGLAFAEAMREATVKQVRPLPQIDTCADQLRALLGERVFMEGLAGAVISNGNAPESEQTKGPK